MAVAQGVSLALRYLRKYRRISLAQLHDMSQWVTILRTASEENESDILTKPMPAETLRRHLEVLGYWPLADPRLHVRAVEALNTLLTARARACA